MKRFFLLFLLVVFFQLHAQDRVYRSETEKVFSLIHTKLKVDFNFDNSTMNGEEWVTLKPYFYPQKELILDAKGMLVHSVSIGDKALEYTYDKRKMVIQLPRMYKRNEELTLYIKYTAQPEKVNQKGSSAITSAKGLYFIDPKDEDPEKPTQIWTQGETEASSCWFPTLDAPNQKTSQEIYITVPNKFVTLSNGKIEKQTKNPNGTRTDHWKFTKKHAPYLFFMGVGEFEIVKDVYKGKDVDYYVEKKYAPYAKQIFGDTPKMLAFFSKITGVEYPWDKYSQLVGRDYVSGAMENTTAVIHGEHAYQVPGQLIDQNTHEKTIAHEAFHHWFGDLVTAESWSNLTVNESFANYSEYLWFEHKYGKDYADSHLFSEAELYKTRDNHSKHLVRFHYTDKEDMFDAVSYNKGGRILHMLRNYIGDVAFFESMKTYLTDNQFGTAEAHQWRLAVEKVTGKDLSWFFNQWYFGSGHPVFDVSYDFNKLSKSVTVNINQTQLKDFKFPLTIDVLEEGKMKRHQVFVKQRESSFTFKYQDKPSLIVVNADGVLLCDINENKVLQDYVQQLLHAKSYKHKREALLKVVDYQKDKKVFQAVVKTLDDSFFKLRKIAVERIDLSNKNAKKKQIEKIKQLAVADPKTLVRAAAIETLGKLTDPKLKFIFIKGLESKSYSVVGKSLVALYYIDKVMAVEKSKKLPVEVKQIIATPLTRIYLEEKADDDLEFIAGNVLSGMYLNANKEVQSLYKKAFDKIAKSNNTKAIMNLTGDVVVKGKKYKQYGFVNVGIELMRTMVAEQQKANLSNRQKNIQIIEQAMKKLLKEM